MPENIPKIYAITWLDLCEYKTINSYILQDGLKLCGISSAAGKTNLE